MLLVTCYLKLAAAAAESRCERKVIAAAKKKRKVNEY